MVSSGRHFTSPPSYTEPRRRSSSEDEYLNCHRREASAALPDQKLYRSITENETKSTWLLAGCEAANTVYARTGFFFFFFFSLFSFFLFFLFFFFFFFFPDRCSRHNFPRRAGTSSRNAQLREYPQRANREQTGVNENDDI